ncbi:DUF2254 domain-containing protein [Pseudarthrobacter sp. AL07]|uniref:DUF2254 domain-containing protein n=1 Tax=unclassified Pseudarthrobacter TaxID=2647000 RepID=UPI002499D56D|nr:MULTISPECIES: DUF2254 domain-containing protein [unclassified Pseudarthrobacter]MDI3196228.1 DUF2254 domain-containing protein [Pseudarthrobacter sp. AL20]MDI3209569.1 DUF2254 domain-containing protein [Pseudarthrobacter sp. AL07]
MFPMTGRVDHWMDALRTQLWPLPVLAVALAVVLGTAVPALDAAVDGKLPESVTVLLFSGGPEAARSVLQAISGSLITVTSLTFSLTVVTLQLASSQFSPRLLRTFTSDRFVHGTLALFLAAFAFALTVLRSVRGEGSGASPFVPEISVTVAFVLAIGSVIGLVLFLAHLTREIRVETMMRRVNVETQETIDRVFPENRPLPAPGPDPVPAEGKILINSTSSGFLTSVDKGSLKRAAEDAGAVIRIDREPGSSLVAGVPFATVWAVQPGATLTTSARERLIEKVNAAVATGFERTNVQDVGFGFRQLVDVAARALSPGINDPTTAVHVIGHLSVLLCRLAERSPGPEQLRDDGGRVRVVVSLPELEDLLNMAMNQPRQYGAADPAVAGRLLGLLAELTWCDRKDKYRVDIREHLGRMRNAIGAADYSPAERRSLLEQADSIELMQPKNLHPGNPASP